MATKVETLFNSNGEMFYPLTHVKAVVNDSGENVEQLLEAQDDKMFPKSSVAQETGDSETKVMSQKAVSSIVSVASEIDSFLEDITIEAKEGGIADSVLRTDGTVSPIAGFAISPFIEVMKEKVYYIKPLSIANIYALLAMYDSDKRIVNVIRGGELSSSYHYKLNLPTSVKYLRCSYYVNTPSDYIYSRARYNNMNDLPRNSTPYFRYANISLDALELVDTEFTDGIFGSLTGGNYYTSDYIELNNFPTYLLLRQNFYSGVNIVEFYDVNKKLIHAVKGGQAGYNDRLIELVPPTNAKYVRYSRGIYDTKGVYGKPYGILRFSGIDFKNQVRSAFGITKPYEELTYPNNSDVTAVDTTFEDGIFGAANAGFFTSDYIDITSGDMYYINTQNFDESYAKAKYYDVSKNEVQVIGGKELPTNRLVKLTPPPYAKYIRYATYKKINEVYTSRIVPFDEAVRKVVGTHSGKTILWIGTSIPEGATYPQVACNNNRYNCINNALGASRMRWTGIKQSSVNSWSGRSLTATVDELETTYRSSVTDGSISESDLNQWKDKSYQRSIIPYIDGTNTTQVDAIVIDHGFNDRENIAELLENESSIDWNSRDRSNFIGAFNYLLDRIQEINPTIKIVIGGYFQNHYAPYFSEQICRMQKMIAEHYGFEILPVWEYSQINDKHVIGTSTYIQEFNSKYGTDYTKMEPDEDGNIIALQLYCPDKVHPHSDLTGNCNKRLDAVYTKLLRSIV